MKQKKPIVLTLFTLFSFLLGVYGIYRIVLLIRVDRIIYGPLWDKTTLLERIFHGPPIGFFRTWGLSFIYVLFFFVSIGMIKLRSWARILAIVLCSCISLYYIIFLPLMIRATLRMGFGWEMMDKDCLFVIFMIVFFLGIVYFLTRSKLAQHFN
jgi:hypothetical protein